VRKVFCDRWFPWFRKVLFHKSKDWNYMDDAYSSKKFKLEAVECKGTSIQLDADM
jgi:hypothetical protein